MLRGNGNDNIMLDRKSGFTAVSLSLPIVLNILDSY